MNEADVTIDDLKALTWTRKGGASAAATGGRGRMIIELRSAEIAGVTIKASKTTYTLAPTEMHYEARGQRCGSLLELAAIINRRWEVGDKSGQDD